MQPDVIRVAIVHSDGLYRGSLTQYLSQFANCRSCVVSAISSMSGKTCFLRAYARSPVAVRKPRSTVAWRQCGEHTNCHIGLLRGKPR